jgi:hypothetical protein
MAAFTCFSLLAGWGADLEAWKLGSLETWKLEGLLAEELVSELDGELDGELRSWSLMELAVL